MIRVLLRPFAYLRITHPQKWQVDWLIPIVLSAATVVSLWCIGGLKHITADKGLFANIYSFVDLLPGFYIAALAAIATFNKQDIDEVMPEPTPRIGVDIGGHKNSIRLTRRRFLAMLFSFLCAESIVLSILLIFFCSLSGNILIPATHAWYLPLKILVCTAVLFVFWQLMIATFFGLFYLGDRLLAPTLTPPKE